VDFISRGWDGFTYPEYDTGIIPFYIILIPGIVTVISLFSMGKQKTNYGKLMYNDGHFIIKCGTLDYDFTTDKISKIDADLFEDRFTEKERLMITFYGIERTGLTVHITHHNSKTIWGNYFKLMGELKSKGVNIEFKETAI
jgi:hypothetical protein